MGEEVARAHPDWEHRLWRDDTGEKQIVSGSSVHESWHRDLLVRACHISQRVNILRYELLLAYGGLYVDADVEPLSRVDSAIDDLEAFVPPHSDDPGLYANSVIGVTTGHPFAGDLVAGLRAQDPAVSLSMGSRYMTSVARRHPEVTVLSPEIFYHCLNPWTSNLVPGTLPLALPPGVRAVHHFSAFWHGEGFKPIAKSEDCVPLFTILAQGKGSGMTRERSNITVEVPGIGTVRIHDKFFKFAETCLVNNHLDEKLLVEKLTRDDPTISAQVASDAARIFAILYRQIDN